MKDAKEEVLDGSCCCGAVRYTLRGPFGSFTHCHCVDCRKSSGAAFASFLGVDRSRFAWRQGAEDVAGFTTETGTRREFCRRCGSTLTGTVGDEPENIYITAASLDTPLSVRPDYHIFVRSKVPWLDVHDGLPQKREYT